jgi:pimeloyl-ACP methyl ester carboxylesterase
VVLANLERYSPDPVVRERIRPLMLNSPKKGVMAALKGMAERPDMMEFLTHLAVPGVVVAGGADAIISIEKAGEIAQMMPRGWMVEVPGGGHMPMYEAPEIVANAIIDLMDRV